jgi:hypothetical protein
LQEVKSIAAQFIKDRQAHLTAAQNIERDLLGLRDQLDGILKGSPVPAALAGTPRVPAKRPGRPVGSRNRVKKTAKTTVKSRSPRSRGRNGGLSGTQKIEAILSKATGNRMESGALAAKPKSRASPIRIRPISRSSGATALS